MEPTSEFLPAQQCFIVYDDLTKKVAISLRNRLSKHDVKCTIWDEKQFRDNEARLSNFNRLLILSEKVADEYLAAYGIPAINVTEYVYYKREGRVATLLLKKDIKFDDVFKYFENNMKKLLETLHITENDTSKSSNDIATALDEAFVNLDSETPITSVAVRRDTSKNDYIAKGAALLTTVSTGVAFGLLGLIAGYGYLWHQKNLSEKDKKLILLFAASREFEQNFFDDFVNAK